MKASVGRICPLLLLLPEAANIPWLLAASLHSPLLWPHCLLFYCSQNSLSLWKRPLWVNFGLTWIIQHNLPFSKPLSNAITAAQSLCYLHSFWGLGHGYLGVSLFSHTPCLSKAFPYPDYHIDFLKTKAKTVAFPEGKRKAFQKAMDQRLRGSLGRFWLAAEVWLVWFGYRHTVCPHQCVWVLVSICKSRWYLLHDFEVWEPSQDSLHLSPK